jgi:hypothetical protein
MMTTMYESIMKAAEQIEQWPDSFKFMATGIPKKSGGNINFCGSPGCALGWIGFFRGFRSGGVHWHSFSSVCEEMGLMPRILGGGYSPDRERSYHFYDRMDQLFKAANPGRWKGEWRDTGQGDRMNISSGVS